VNDTHKKTNKNENRVWPGSCVTSVLINDLFSEEGVVTLFSLGNLLLLAAGCISALLLTFNPVSTAMLSADTFYVLLFHANKLLFAVNNRGSLSTTSRYLGSYCLQMQK